MSKKYYLLVFIGRLQPLHNAHLEIIKRATTLAHRILIITGSADQPRTYKNPFTSYERASMIKTATSGLDIAVSVAPNPDSIYNDTAWAARIQSIVASYAPSGKIGIIGHKKDSSSDYLNMFPQWEFESVDLIEPLNATDVRDLYFRNDVNMNFIKNVVPRSTFDFLDQFKDTPEYAQIIQEREFVTNYKKQFASLPYPPIFVTTDALVVCSGHVLLVERKAFPGKGLLALPGGFLNVNERIASGVIRELKEETKIKVPVPVLEGSIKRVKVFDHPDRSSRGRTITHCFLIDLGDGALPKVKGSDDAKHALWVPISKISSDRMYEDHYQIIQDLIGLQ